MISFVASYDIWFFLNRPYAKAPTNLHICAESSDFAAGKYNVEALLKATAYI